MIVQAQSTRATCEHFANFDRLVRTWYCAMPSARLKHGPQLRFTPAFTEADEPLRLFAEVANTMEAL
jgi:hypothetical protein